MKQIVFNKRNLLLIVVLLCALGLKLFYSTASVNELRWILAPTTFFVELISGKPFEFESHAGYMASDHSFLIAASCAGVNFLITSFLMLALRKLWRDRSQKISWKFLPQAALFAYLATIVANAARISLALRLRRLHLETSWLTPNELHRFEGIVVYFGFLWLLFMVSERLNWENAPGLRRLLRLSVFPLLIYYATVLGIPLANGAYRRGNAATDFREHSVFVLVIPLLVIPLLLMFVLAVSPFYTAKRSLLGSQKQLNRS